MAYLAQAITTQEVGRLGKVPGIGKKIAERLRLKLKGKLSGDILGLFAVRTSDAHSDIQQVVIVLGYSAQEAAATFKSLAVNVWMSEGIKPTLKALNR